MGKVDGQVKKTLHSTSSDRIVERHYVGERPTEPSRTKIAESILLASDRPDEILSARN